MRKRLLMQLMAVMAAIGVYAQGEYFYTHTAKYVTTDVNQVSNSSFDGLDGWQNELGQAVMSQFWILENGAAPTGGNALISTGDDAADGGALIYKVSNLTEGTYGVTFWVKAETGFTTSITDGAANYIDVFVSKTGDVTKTTDDKQVAQVEIIGSEWQQVGYRFDAEDGDAVIIRVAKLAAGTMFAGLSVSSVMEVFDTRIADRMLAYADRLLADENLPNGRDDFREWIENDFKAALAIEELRNSKDDMQGFVDAFNDEYLPAFLGANGTNLMPAYLQDWTDWGKINYNSLGTKDNWTFEGGRWGFTGNQEYLEFAEGDGYIASAGIQVSQNALNVGVRTRAEKLDNLPFGKYFFSIEVQAVAASNRANPYGADHSVVIAEPWFFFGEEQTVLPDTLNGYYWKTLYAIGELKEGQEKVIGFHFPVLDHKKGGRYSLRNPKVYLLGESEEDVNFKTQKEAFTVQQYNLSKRLTEYPVELNTTDYPWEQDSLARAIATAQPVYDASLLIIDAEGNVLNKQEVTEENTQLLLDQVNALGRARSFVINQNAPIASLREAVAAAKESLTNEAYAHAAADKRSNLENAVNHGQQLLDGISSENQGDAFNSATSDILAAKEEFEATAASRANPTDILIKNADFSDFSNNSNITSAGTTKDWNWTMAASTNRWEIRDNETLSKGHGATVWRGTTVALDGKAQQTVKLTYEGLYEYRAEAYISEERVNELVAAAQVLDGDTIFTPNIRLFFGEDGLADSITISKWYNGVKNDGTYFTRESNGTKYGGIVYATYSVFFKKTGTAPVVAEFGLEARDNGATAGANGFGFGNNRIYYLGDEAQYLTDTKADVAKAVAAARNTLASVPANYLTVKLQRYVDNAEKAETAKELQNALFGIQEITSRLAALTNSVGGIFADDPKASRKADGVYTLQGVKLADSADHLKSGLYIVNGKKILVK